MNQQDCRHRERAVLLVLAVSCFVLPEAGRAQDLGSALYIRTDSDHTTIVAPRARVQAPIAKATKLSFVYAADIWTSASIDIMTSASQRPVTEQRDELDVSADQEFEDVILTASYRYSTEPDYVSHGVSGGFSYDFADNNATLAMGLSASADTVGRAGDPQFSRPVGTLGGRLSFTQVLGVGTVAQAMYELSRTSGYLASPYRFVPIGGDGFCTSGVKNTGGIAPLCLRENDPGERLRHAAALELRQALGSTWSLGAGYRFYIDDWSLSSHTIRAELAWLLDPDSTLSFRYRFYTQGSAKFYRERYATPQPYMTTDKELSSLSSNRFGLEADHTWHFRDDRKLTTTLSFAPILYSYRNFLPLDHITAFEVTAGLVFVP
jgi:hypothetical protein